MTDYRGLLKALSDEKVEFIVIGGFAAAAHGSSRFTADVDVVYRRSVENMARLTRALAPHGPYLRGAPIGLPFSWDVRTVETGLNFTLETRLGDIDLFGEVAGGGSYENLLGDSEDLELFGRRLRVVTLRRLIALKRAAGRPKDLEAIAELEALAEESG
jgi:predicted nucleotidyltransferase